ncbi:MAG TPA: ZIP family metal transporter [Euryarchaeota archaeon]|nr:ZIP family metal transporter [Euryarchaeota archaeon]
MEAVATFALYSVLLLVVSMAGALLPRVKKLSDRQAHLLMALSAGIFLGLLFFLLLPEAVHECQDGGYDIHQIMYAIVAGFVLIMTVEMLLKHRHMGGCSCECCQDNHSHKITSMSSFAGLSVHAACDGLALAATFLAGEEVGLIATVGMCIHKLVVLFSLSTTMILTDFTQRQSLIRLFAFSLITPLAGVVFFIALGGIGDIEGLTGIPLAFAAGTFMYVSMCDILPEAYHRKKQDLGSYGLVILGIVLILAFSLLFPHTH